MVYDLSVTQPYHRLIVRTPVLLDDSQSALTVNFLAASVIFLLLSLRFDSVTGIVPDPVSVAS